MNDKFFENPVYVKHGSFVVQEIQCVMDALDFLDGWPDDRRGMMFQITQTALYRAHDGMMPIVAARNAFTQWARSVGILEDVSIAPPWMTGPKVGGGGIPV